MIRFSLTIATISIMLLACCETASATSDPKAKATQFAARMKSIVIPSLELKQTPADFAFSMIADASKAYDAGKKGIKIVYKGDSNVFVSFSGKRVTVYDALRQILLLIGAQSRVQGDTLIISAKK